VKAQNGRIKTNNTQVQEAWKKRNYKNVNDIQRERMKNTGTAKRMIEEPIGDVRYCLA
jgi:hypothetical protein